LENIKLIFMTTLKNIYLTLFFGLLLVIVISTIQMCFGVYGDPSEAVALVWSFMVVTDSMHNFEPEYN